MNGFGNVPSYRGDSRVSGIGLIYERNCPTRSLECSGPGPEKDSSGWPAEYAR